MQLCSYEHASSPNPCVSVEEAYKIAKDTEDIYLNSTLKNEAALRQAIRKFNKEK